MVSGIIRYWAAAKEAAGKAEEPVSGATLADVLESVRGARSGDDRLLRVLDRSSFVVDEYPVGGRAHADVELDEGYVIEVLPPFAGG
ncbi:MoaD/ThiS family protein [Streptomonospora salina]|uniref:Molybdopterin converting factor small subunit n=1 Tax=Streptomonospora salina TaxID=104205 RepID=A0A841E9F2_9ACTN|nr:MoaD/ThiS family protein [Streptomonospora salina]MBB5999094.1 molybdopterin converting factor small subunit [Streptomonospora salina]